MSYEDVGVKIKERRMEVNMSAAELAERISLSKATIHRYENGDIKNIKMPVLEAMAEALRVNPLWLIGKSEIKDGETTYDVCAVLDDLIANLKLYTDITCCGEPLPSNIREKLIFGLEVVRGALK